MTEKHIAFMLSKFQRETADPLDDYNENILDYFVHSVYLYDDKLVVAYNLADNEKRPNFYVRS